MGPSRVKQKMPCLSLSLSPSPVPSLPSTLACRQKRAHACAYCRATGQVLQAWQAEGESPVTAIHSFLASSSEERHRGAGPWSIDKAPPPPSCIDQGHPRAWWALDAVYCMEPREIPKKCEVVERAHGKKHQRDERGERQERQRKREGTLFPIWRRGQIKQAIDE